RQNAGRRRPPGPARHRPRRRQRLGYSWHACDVGVWHVAGLGWFTGAPARDLRRPALLLAFPGSASWSTRPAARPPATSTTSRRRNASGRRAGLPTTLPGTIPADVKEIRCRTASTSTACQRRSRPIHL